MSMSEVIGYVVARNNAGVMDVHEATGLCEFGVDARASSGRATYWVDGHMDNDQFKVVHGVLHRTMAKAIDFMEALLR